MTTRLTPLCFRMKKRRFLSLDIKHFAEATQGHYGFHKGDLVEQKPVNIDLRAKYSLQNCQSSKPTLSLNIQRDKLIESYTLYNTQVYEYFPDWSKVVQ